MVEIDSISESVSINQGERRDEADVLSTNIDHEAVSSSCDSYVNSNSIKFEAPDGTFLWLPKTEDVYTPKVGMEFENVNKCIDFYSNYSDKAGFNIRLSTQKRTTTDVVIEKHILCSRAGFPNEGDVDTLDETKKQNQTRNVNIKRTDCKAKIIFKMIDGTGRFRISSFELVHNHELTAAPYSHHSRKRRQLQYSEQTFINNVSTSNIGATKAHHIYSQIKGSYELVHGTIVDFKNFKRDINCFVAGSDCQMLVTKLSNRKEHVSNFSFDFKTENCELSNLFWADEVAKLNYREFGDIVSFDATYNTNKYKLVFVPFTGIDNHRKCVTFGAGMIRKEDTESYKWLLTSFLKAFRKQPTIIVTDQDPAMRKAIAAVFTESRHRLCMWHITNKLPAKICQDILDNTDFKKKFHRLVWSLFIGTSQFEKRWEELLKEFKLKKNKWLHEMFGIRDRWIPAYFRDLLLCDLMRTTSRSESENSFFSNFSNDHSTMINFMNCFEAAMERQRHKQETLDYQTLSTNPKYKTPLPIERHANKLYTRTIFNLVQQEIYMSVWSCSQISLTSEEGVEVCIVKEIKKRTVDTSEEQDRHEELERPENDRSTTEHEYKVIHNRADDNFACSCMKFIREGILCRHIFCVLKSCNMEQIPEKYILRRWTRNIIPAEVRSRRHKYNEMDEECDILAMDSFSAVDYCIGLLVNNKEKLSDFNDKIQKIRREVEEELPKEPLKKKNLIIQSMLGVSQPENIEIKNPSGIRNKGCGTGGRRLKGKAEIAKEFSKKKPRHCKKCGATEKGHDSRTHDRFVKKKQKEDIQNSEVDVDIEDE